MAETHYYITGYIQWKTQPRPLAFWVYVFFKMAGLATRYFEKYQKTIFKKTVFLRGPVRLIRV